ncbi:MAG: hypothetical protein V3U45_07645 [bacterium]
MSMPGKAGYCPKCGELWIEHEFGTAQGRVFAYRFEDDDAHEKVVCRTWVKVEVA